jgi:hypothetical protein
MIVPGSASPLLASAGGYNLTKSLRFRGSVSAFLNRTPASSSNRRTWTWSGWVKLGRDPDGFFPLFGADANGYPCSGIALTNFNIQFFSYTHPSYDWQKISTMVLRDPSAWYHIVAVTDTTNGTTEDRARVYINGQRITSWSTNNNPSPSFEGYVNSSSYVTKVGRFAGFGYFDGCMSEVNFVDGLALDPSSFGQTSTSTGAWIPKKYTGTYGTNGFYLQFTDNSALTTSSNVGLGKDFSGNGNYLATNNISITAGSTYDSMTDVPTLTSATAANYAVLNPLQTTQSASAPTNANLTSPANAGVWRRIGGSMQLPTTGKCYFEYTCDSFSSFATFSIGVFSGNIDTGNNVIGTSATEWGYNGQSGYASNNNSNISSGFTTATTGDVLRLAYDASTGSLWFGINNTWQGASSPNPSTGTSPTYTGVYNITPVMVQNWATQSANFGQRPFAFTPPTGFKALNTFNLSTPTITQPNKNFDTVIWTGDQTNKQIPLNFTADFVWAKRRDSGDNHVLYDAIRGVNNGLNSNTPDPEQTNDYGLDFDNGNYLAIDGTKYFGGGGGSGITFVAWNWKESVSAGFDILTYTGNGGTGASSQYVNHSLGVTPNVIITKVRSSGASNPNWYVYHSAVQNGAASYYGFLNSATQWSTGSSPYQLWTLNPTQIAFNEGANESGKNYVAYVFAEVAGYSKFGSYTGNGDPNGTFIYTGFRPRYLMIKSTSTESWELFDTSRSPFNQAVALLEADSPAGENNSSTSAIDILSNGFKQRNTRAATNASSTTYIYMAFAESPFKYANAR